LITNDTGTCKRFLVLFQEDGVAKHNSVRLQNPLLAAILAGTIRVHLGVYFGLVILKDDRLEAQRLSRSCQTSQSDDWRLSINIHSKPADLRANPMCTVETRIGADMP
jgi:hypothetical protein